MLSYTELNITTLKLRATDAVVHFGSQVPKMSPHSTARNLGFKVTKYPVPFQLRSSALLISCIQ